MNRIIDASDDKKDNEEYSLRPTEFKNYIGQEKIKKNLSVFIEAAKKRNEVLDHVLLYGPPGLGKTTLAYIIANQMDTSIKVTSAPNIEKAGDLAAILTNLSEGDILFIDEIHRLNRAIEEILYPAMEDFKLDIIIGSGPAAQTMQIDLSRFTLIGATTRAGMVSHPLRDRFGMHFRMKFYSVKELQQIINLASVKLNKKIEENSSEEIAKRSRKTPRIALRLLKRVRDFSDIKDEQSISFETCRYGLKELGIDEHGFDDMDIKLLKLLLSSAKPIGLSTISAMLNEDEDTIEDVVEPFLISSGYIERTPKGRTSTEKTRELFKEL